MRRADEAPINDSPGARSSGAGAAIGGEAFEEGWGESSRGSRFLCGLSPVLSVQVNGADLHLR